MVSYVQIVTNIDGCKVVCSLPQSNKCDEIIMFVANIVTMCGLALETRNGAVNNFHTYIVFSAFNGFCSGHTFFKNTTTLNFIKANHIFKSSLKCRRRL